MRTRNPHSDQQPKHIDGATRWFGFGIRLPWSLTAYSGS
ncbi:hypothetical protein D046_9140, partial [Vibrio parahaemolyticus V-223/04]